MARPAGSRTHLLKRRTTARDRAWTSMRILRRFTYPQLIASAECSRDNVRIFIYALAAAGIVRVSTPKRNGHKGGHQVMLLIKDLGPLAPRVQADGKLYDPNAHGVYLPGGEFRPCGEGGGKSATSVQKQ